jgi:hypothetical protein
VTKLKRRPHFLRATEKTETPVHAIWFDTESAQDEFTPGTLTHRLTFGWAAYRRKRDNGAWTKPEWFRFTSAGEFWQFVEDRAKVKTKLYVFCHNTSIDLPLLDAIRTLAEGQWKLSLCVIDAPPTILKYRRNRRTLVLLDTLNIFRMPLKALGEAIGLPKLDMPDITVDSAEANRYCRRDVEIIMETCLRWWRFLEDNNLGSFAHTLASQSMRSFLHRFMEHRILIDDNASATGVSRGAYFGARTECFRLGPITHRTWLVDINSQYPAMMQQHEFPTRLIGYDRRPTLPDLASWCKTRAICARVTLRTENPAYPLRMDNRITFPVGQFTTTLSTPEVLYALERGHIIKAHEVAIYHKAPIFKTFVDFFYEGRLRAQAAGDGVNSLLYKILMNSLYGKFGQRGLVWETLEQIEDLTAKTWEEYDHDTRTVVRYRQLGGIRQRQETEAESRASHPAIAAHVTAYARLLLWDMINTAGRANVYYVDTDGLLVNEAGFHYLTNHIDDFALGKLKLEDTFPDAEIFAPKDYRFGDRRKTKGVKKNAIWDSLNSVTQDQWSTLARHVREGAVNPPTTKRIKKTLSREYKKGVVDTEGHITPYRLNGASAGNTVSS